MSFILEDQFCLLWNPCLTFSFLVCLKYITQYSSGVNHLCKYLVIRFSFPFKSKELFAYVTKYFLFLFLQSPGSLLGCVLVTVDSLRYRMCSLISLSFFHKIIHELKFLVFVSFYICFLQKMLLYICWTFFA